MGEQSKELGEAFENYSKSLLKNFKWNILGSNIEIKCTRHSSHKQKNTHGIDLLAGYYNPFKNKNEAVIIECKNRKWEKFIPSEVNSWLEELRNNIECSSNSAEVVNRLDNHTLIGGILLYNSSDGEYDAEKAKRTISSITISNKRFPYILYLADTRKLSKWDAFSKEIVKLREIDPDFSIIYPSICGSEWKRIDIVTPNYLFSDFIIGSYLGKPNNPYIHEESVEKKVIFYFDAINTSSLIYLKSMINELQIEATNGNNKEICFYFFPETIEDSIFLSKNFNQIYEKDNFYYEKMNIKGFNIY